MLMTRHADRLARGAEKRQLLLRFLREEIYTTPAIIGLLLGIAARQAVHKTIAAGVRDGLLASERISLGDGRKVALVGITPTGQALAFDPKTEQHNPRYFEPGRVGISVLAHTLDLQCLRIACERAGWLDWLTVDREGYWQPGRGRPDVIATAPNGERVAIECERTIKTLKRYEVIVAERLQAIRAQRYARCIWTCGTQMQTEALRSIIGGIDSVPVAGTRVQLEPRHREILHFASYEQLPTYPFSNTKGVQQ